MFNLKKKLNAIMPGEVRLPSRYSNLNRQLMPQGTRGALQNVLTVDWSGHKTVLVEVPGSGAHRSNEVEMNGMGEGDYGRLIDDDEVSIAFAACTISSSHDWPRSSGCLLILRTKYRFSETGDTLTNQDTAVNSSTRPRPLFRAKPSRHRLPTRPAKSTRRTMGGPSPRTRSSWPTRSDRPTSSRVTCPSLITNRTTVTRLDTGTCFRSTRTLPGAGARSRSRHGETKPRWILGQDAVGVQATGRARRALPVRLGRGHRRCRPSRIPSATRAYRITSSYDREQVTLESLLRLCFSSL
jgi:hypothetical protein